MASRRPRILSVVPRQHQWLRTLVDSLSQAGIPWHSAVLANRSVKIRLSAQSRSPFCIVVRPRDSGLPGFNSTARFVIGYDGARDLNTDQRQWLGKFHELLGSLEPSLPPDLQGFASVGLRQGAPEEILRGLFPFVTVERSLAASQKEMVEVLVRAISRCNQACPFCSAPRHDEPDSEILWACLKAAADLLPGAMLSLTGGEPTLRPAFPAEVEAALRLDFSQVQIQTNAVRFADRLDPAALPKDDRLSFFVSLHAWDAEIYDRCTGTSGQLYRAQQGLRRILDAGHAVIVNMVINSENIDHLEEMVRSFAGEFAGENPPVLHFSVLICPEWNPEALRYLVRYSQVVAALARAVETARELGIRPQLTSTHASLPPCLLDQQSRRSRYAYRIEPHETGYEDFTRPWVKAAVCRECTETQHCLGVPRPYAEKFGLDELAPLRAAE